MGKLGEKVRVKEQRKESGRNRKRDNVGKRRVRD